MKIYKNVLALVGNTNFCTADEALEYLKNCYDDNIWISVLNRADITPKEAIDLATKRNKVAVWSEVLSRPDIKPTTAFALLAGMISNKEIWISVINRPDIDFGTAFSFAETLDNCNVWIATFKKPDADPKVIAERAFMISDSDVWGLILEKPDIVTHLDSIPISEIMEIAELVGNWNLWAYIVRRKDCGIDYIFSSIKKSESSDLVEECLKRSDFIEHLNNMPIKEALEHAREAESWRIWLIISCRQDIDPKTAIYLIKESDDVDVFNSVLEREDVIKYLNAISVTKLLELGLAFDNWRFWKYINENERVGNYLKTINLTKAMRLLRRLKGNMTCDAIVKRDDFPANNITKLISEIPNLQNFWPTIVVKPGFSKQFNLLSDAEAIALAQSLKAEHLYQSIVKRESLLPKDLLILAKEINEQETWDIVLARPDVIEFLQIGQTA